jgi:hypothetical protein
MIKEQRHRVRLNWPLIAVLLFGLILRVLFAPGVGYEGSLEVMQSASSIASALKPLSPNHLLTALPELRAKLGWPRIVAQAPLGASYALFGETDLVTRLFGLLSSLAGLLILYRISRRMTSEIVAVIAILVYALIPLDIFYSGTPTYFTFWLPVTLLLAHLSDRIMERKAVFPVLFAMIGILLLTVVEFWLGFFVVVLWASKWIEVKLPGRGVWLPVFITLVAAVASVIAFWPEMPGWRHVLLEPGMGLLIPLFVIALMAAFVMPGRWTRPAFLWLTTAMATFLGCLAVGSQAMNLSPIILLIVAGFCLISGVYLVNQPLPKIPLPAFVLILAATLIFAYFGLSAQTELIPSFDGFHWLGFHSVFLFSNIIGGIFIVLLLVSASQFSRNKKSVFINFLTLALFPFSMLSPIGQKTLPFQAMTSAVKAAVQALDDVELPLRVYVTDSQVRNSFSYYITQVGSDLRIVQQRWDGPEGISDGYILALEGGLRDLPETWLKLDTFGGPMAPTRLVLHRFLTPRSAEEELQVAGDLVREIPNANNYQRYYAALINGGKACDAYEAWMKSKELDGGDSDSIPIQSNLNCFETPTLTEEQMSFVDLEALRVNTGSIRVEPAGLDEEGQPMWQVFRTYDIYYDPRLFDIKIPLDPDVFYLYSANVMGGQRAPFYTLYWRIGNIEKYLDRNFYPYWTRVSLLVYSGVADSGDADLRLSPVLSDNLESVFVSQLELSKILLLPKP